MTTKAERTTQFIIETVAPVFNKYGYFGTSLADITKVTGLTKGAIYGNFESKEHLALESFNYMLRKLLKAIDEKIIGLDSPVQKLKAFTDFYRHYLNYSKIAGGCPIINVGVDSQNNNPLLTQRVRYVIKKIESNIEGLIHEGKEIGEFKKTVNEGVLARRIFSIMEGSIFMAMTTEKKQYLNETMDFVDEMIDRELRI